jgi:hypothetical protein
MSLAPVPGTELGPVVVPVASGYPTCHFFCFFVFWGNCNVCVYIYLYMTEGDGPMGPSPSSVNQRTGPTNPAPTDRVHPSDPDPAPARSQLTRAPTCPTFILH